MEKQKAIKWKVAAAFMVIFLAGLGTGYILNHLIQTSSISPGWHSHRSMQNERSMNQGERQRQIRARMVNTLNLTDNQKEEFFDHMRSYRERMIQLTRDQREAEQDKIRQEYETLKANLSGLLQPEQLKKLDRHLHPDSVRHNRRRELRP